MRTLRDVGLLALALCLVQAIVVRLARRRDERAALATSNRMDGQNEGSDFYLHDSDDVDSREAVLKSVLADFPRRQDIRLQLLELYASNLSTNLFGDEARIMFRMTRGNTPEWHRVVQLGLELDADIDFYKMGFDDNLFDSDTDFGLNDGDRVSSIPAGGRGRNGSTEPSVSFEELMRLHNTVATEESGKASEDVPEPYRPDGDGSVDFDARWADGGSAAAVGEPSSDSDFSSGVATDSVEETVGTTSDHASGETGEAASTTPTPLPATSPVPLSERPVYVPEDDEELLAITVNYTYGVHKLDIVLDEGRELDDSHAIDVSMDEALADMSSVDEDDPFVDLVFRADEIDQDLARAETCAAAGDRAEARRLLDEIVPLADADQRRRAEALRLRLDESDGDESSVV